MKRQEVVIFGLTLALGVLMGQTLPTSGPEVTSPDECDWQFRRTTPERFADPARVYRCNGYLFETLHRYADGSVAPRWALGIAHNGNVAIGDPGPAGRLTYVPTKELEVLGTVAARSIKFTHSEPWKQADQHVWIPIELPDGSRGWLAVWRW